MERRGEKKEGSARRGEGKTRAKWRREDERRERRTKEQEPERRRQRSNRGRSTPCVRTTTHGVYNLTVVVLPPVPHARTAIVSLLLGCGRCDHSVQMLLIRAGPCLFQHYFELSVSLDPVCFTVLVELRSCEVFDFQSGAVLTSIGSARVARAVTSFADHNFDSI